MKRTAAVADEWWFVPVMVGACVALAGMLMSGCDGGSGPGEEGQLVDQAGGTVESADGRALAEFPAAAVDGEVLVAIARASGLPIDERILPSAAYVFEPAGSQFGLPVRLSIAYNPRKIPAQFAEADLRLCRLVNGAWEGLADSYVDAEADTVRGNVDGFSTYAVGALAAGRRLVVEDTWDSGADFPPVDVAVWSDGPQDNWVFVGLADLPLVGILTRTPTDLDDVSSIQAFGAASRVAFEHEGRPAPPWPADATQHALCWIDPVNCRVGYSVFVLRDSECVGTIYDVEPWGEPGSGPGQFLNPGGLDFDAHSHIFVADTGNRRVQEFDVEGNFIRQYGPHTGGVQMLEPTDVACSHGYLWIVDRGRHCVWVWRAGAATPAGWRGKSSSNGVGFFAAGIAPTAIAGDEPGALNAPTAIASSPDGRSVCVADSGNERVQMFSGTGVLRALTADELSVPAHSDFTGTAVGGSGAVYVADPENNRVVVLGVQVTPP
ncbi:MAG: NHL repeat-containing protein [Armatimonadota bacterium]